MADRHQKSRRRLENSDTWHSQNPFGRSAVFSHILEQVPEFRLGDSRHLCEAKAPEIRQKLPRQKATSQKDKVEVGPIVLMELQLHAVGAIDSDGSTFPELSLS